MTDLTDHIRLTLDGAVVGQTSSEMRWQPQPDTTQEDAMTPETHRIAAVSDLGLQAGSYATVVLAGPQIDSERFGGDR